MTHLPKLDIEGSERNDWRPQLLGPVVQLSRHKGAA